MPVAAEYVERREIMGRRTLLEIIFSAIAVLIFMIVFNSLRATIADFETQTDDVLALINSLNETNSELQEQLEEEQSENAALWVRVLSLSQQLNELESGTN